MLEFTNPTNFNICDLNHRCFFLSHFTLLLPGSHKVNTHKTRSSFEQIRRWTFHHLGWSILYFATFKSNNWFHGNVIFSIVVRQLEHVQPESFSFPHLSVVSRPLCSACDGPHNYLQLSSLLPQQLHPLLIPDPQAVSLIYTQPQSTDENVEKGPNNNGSLIHH